MASEDSDKETRNSLHLLIMIRRMSSMCLPLISLKSQGY
jgi:hypothetical protein